MRACPVDPDFAVTENGDVFRVRGGKSRPGAPYKMRLHVNRKGYFAVSLNKKLYKVHRLVALTYLPNPLNKPLVAHKDGRRQNNDINNLYWATYIENSADQVRHGTRCCREKHGSAVLTEEQVAQIRASPLSTRRLAKNYGVGQTTIRDVLNERTWRHAN